jgi:hypothetical protein
VARRDRGTAATRAQTELNGRVSGSNGALVNGSGLNGSGASEPDEPGARTIGAMALQRWAAREPGAQRRSTGAPVAWTSGPYDVDDLDPGLAAVDRVDFGAVRLPVPPGGEVTVEPEEGRLQAVHVMLPAGRLSVSALAAPRSERLWPDLAREIDESLRDGGATVRSFTGEWGRELHAHTGEASSVFVGVDGPRWMLYGVATGPTSATAELDTALRRMLQNAVVVRGRAPYPVRTVLPLTVPAHLAGVPSDPSPSGGFAARPSGRPVGLDETALVPPVHPAAPVPADESTGLLPASVDGNPTDPRGLPHVAPADRGAGGRGGTGARVPRDAAESGAGARDWAGRNGATPNGALQNRAGRNGVERNGAAQNGVGRNGAPRAEVGRDRVRRNGASRDGVGRNGAVRGGAEHDGVGRDRLPDTRAPDTGSERTSRVPARPPQRRVADLLAEAERERNATSARAPEPTSSAPPRRPQAPRRPSDRAAPPAVKGGSASPTPTNGPHEGWRPTASHPAQSAGSGYTAPEPTRRQAPDDDDPPLYLGGPGAIDQARTVIGDVPLYRDPPSPTAAGDGAWSSIDLPPREPRWTPVGPPSDGSDDWTVPIPVIRPEPEPEPEPPRGRRARRRRETWPDETWADETRADDPWSGGRRVDEPRRHTQGRHGGHSADRGSRAAGRYPGSNRGGYEPETRSGPAHARPADRWPEPFDRDPRGRHHRPGE